jgi:hypothetical protein
MRAGGERRDAHGSALFRRICRIAANGGCDVWIMPHFFKNAA